MRRDLLVTVTLLASSMLTVMSGAIIAPSLNDLAIHFTSARTQHHNLMASLILVIPSLGIVISAPFMGWVADQYGRWRTLAVSVPVLMASGASGYWADNYVPLLTGRLVLGCAIAGISISATSILGSLPAESKRQDLLGKQSAFINLAGMTYLFLGGLLASMNWRLPFLLYFWPIVLMPFVILSMRIQPLAQKNDIPAAQSGNWNAFLRGSSMPSALLVWVLGGASMAIIYTLFTVHPFRMKELGFEDPRLVSFTIMVATASSAVTSWNLRRISLYLTPYAIFALAFLMFGLGLMAMSMAREIWHVLSGNLLMGIGMGLPVPNGAAWLSTISPDFMRGRILGVFNTCIFIGQFLSPLLLHILALVSPHIFFANASIGVSCLVITCAMLAVTVFQRTPLIRGGQEFQLWR